VTADRYRRVAAAFSARVEAVPDAAWDNPAPCDGWVARDVVRHVVEWMPAFLADAGGPMLPIGPSVDVDPRGAWANLDDALRSLLDDPLVSASTIAHPRAGTHRLDDALRASGEYGPRVDVPADADEQTLLLAFTGRRP